MLYIAQEETSIPIKLPTLNEYLGKITLRFLRKGLNLIHIVTKDIAHLNISITRFRTGWLHSHGKEPVVLCYKSQAFQHIFPESFLVEDSLV